MEKASECSTCRTYCRVKEADRYEDCFPEPPVEEVELAMQDKVKLNAGDPEGGAHPHNHPTWEYWYGYDQSTVIRGKKDSIKCSAIKLQAREKCINTL